MNVTMPAIFYNLRFCMDKEHIFLAQKGDYYDIPHDVDR
jgi:hypothetical protein